MKQLMVGLAVLCLPLPAHAAKSDKTARDFTVLVVGGSAGDGTTPTLSQLKERLQSADPSSAVVLFTGNYSREELPTEAEEGRAQAEAEILAHVTATEDFVRRGGKVYFLAGQQDFAEGGTKAVRRLRKFLNRSFAAVAGDPDSDDKEDLDVMPQAACGTPTQLDLTANLGLLLVNSQWWMQDWVADPSFNEGCEVKTRQSFQETLIDALRTYRNRRLVVASHHPLRSYGEGGGQFTARAHLSPVPLIGTAWVWARQAGLVPQYKNHPLYRSYVEMVIGEAERTGSYVFASGHDANLQFVSLHRQAQIVSGTSGLVPARTVTADPGDFASASPGWVELTFDPSGQGQARYFSSLGEPLFEKELPAVPILAPALSEPPHALPPSPVVAGYSKHGVWKLPGFVKLFVGSYYSDAYSLKLPYDVLDLKIEQGGLKPYKVGGGLQTNSIRLRDPDGGDWAIRATTKDSSRLLPYPLSQFTVASRLLEHGFTATHPEAALSFPRLAEAVGMLHLNPRLMYLPDQEGLGQYRGFITDEVVMLEQRTEGKAKTKSYDDMVEKIMDKPAKHRIDQEAMLRARLLDVFIGDWDRHKGQWRFAVTVGPDGTKTYAPIPMDRDQMFGNYDGLGLVFARLVVPASRALQPFTGNYGRLGWLNYNARNVDAFALNQLTHARWMEIAAEVQKALTDTVIDEAFASWHPETFALDGARIAQALKMRRDKLLSAAEDYYALLSTRVDVLGSAHSDQFDVWFEPGGAVRISVRTRKEGSTPYFDRVFEPNDTQELSLYGLEGDDVLSVHGNPNPQFTIRFVGGEGKDSLSAAGGGEPVDARNIQLYDSEKGAEIDPSIKVRDERSSIASLNQYDSTENHEPDYGSFMPGLVVNPDDGAYLGGQYTHVVHGLEEPLRRSLQPDRLLRDRHSGRSDRLPRPVPPERLAARSAAGPDAEDPQLHPQFLRLHQHLRRRRVTQLLPGTPGAVRGALRLVLRLRRRSDPHRRAAAGPGHCHRADRRKVRQRLS